jgi:hypothetical protein
VREVTADTRVTYAREFLEAIRPHKVSQRPLSVLVREDAELRRMLGRLLDYVAETSARPVLTAADLGTLGQALADAVNYRDPAGFCQDCEDSPATLCQGHADDLDKTDAYLALAIDLGIAVDR